MIDPGHGGRDPGTTWGDYKEKDINLAVGLLLGEMIKENLPEVKVLYTRDRDVFIELADRGKMANNAGADLFISLHVNAVDRGRTAPSGALTLLMGTAHESRNLDVAMRENDVIVFEDDYSTKYQGYEPGSPESFIIFSLLQYAHTEQSMMLAEIMQKHYKQSTPMPDLGARQQPLLVLWQTTMPAVLTEMGFLPNEKDRATLTNKDGQKKIATALFNSFSEYKSRVEGKGSAIQLDATNTAVTERVAQQPARQANVTYMIQVCSSTRQLGQNNATLRPYRGRLTEKKIGNLYKYFVGSCSTYSEALELQAEVRRTTSDAFMVAFDGDRQLSISDARRLTD